MEEVEFGGLLVVITFGLFLPDDRDEILRIRGFRMFHWHRIHIGAKMRLMDPSGQTVANSIPQPEDNMR